MTGESFFSNSDLDEPNLLILRSAEHPGDYMVANECHCTDDCPAGTFADHRPPGCPCGCPALVQSEQP